MKEGDLVKANSRSRWNKGRQGIVVAAGPEADGVARPHGQSKFTGRVRVLWFHPNGTKDKRTWVAVNTVDVFNPAPLGPDEEDPEEQAGGTDGDPYADEANLAQDHGADYDDDGRYDDDPSVYDGTYSEE